MQRIPLRPDIYAVIDDTDFESVSSKKWRLSTQGYAVTGSAALPLQNFIMKPECKLWVDHKDGNKLDCRRKNLRVCTKRQNCFGFRKKSAGKTSQFRGVSWSKLRNKWSAQTWENDTKKHLGLFEIETDAARAYDKRVTEIYGKFAHLNFPK